MNINKKDRTGGHTSIIEKYNYVCNTIKESCNDLDLLNKELEKFTTLQNINTDLINSIVTSIKVEKLSQKILDILIRSLHLEGGMVHILNEDKNQLELKGAKFLTTNLNGIKYINIGDGVIGRTAFSKEVTILTGSQVEEAHWDKENKKLDLPFDIKGDMICIPLLIKKNRLVGTITLLTKEGQHLSETILEILDTLSTQFAIGLQNTIMFEETKEMASKDGLTNLYNHIYFKEFLELELNRSKRYGKPLAIALLDIDYFKNINDNYGHQEGDLILKELAAIIKISVRKTDLVARYGGEEFVVVFPEADSDKIISAAEKLRKKINDHVFSSPVNDHRITVSIGISVFVPDSNKDFINQKELICQADKALYEAKEKGRNNIKIWKG